MGSIGFLALVLVVMVAAIGIAAWVGTAAVHWWRRRRWRRQHVSRRP